jgi:hypothetical protein
MQTIVEKNKTTIYYNEYVLKLPSSNTLNFEVNINDICHRVHMCTQ